MKKLFTTCLVAAMAFAMTSCGGQKSESSEADFDILLAEMATVAEQVEAAETQEAKDSLNVLFEVLGQKLSEFEGTISEEQQAAAKEFLNWLVFDEAGQEFLVTTCALVPAFSNITLPVSDPLGASVKAFADADKLTANYNYAPDDHYAKNGISFQKYLAGQIDRAGLAQEITDYWATAEVGAH